MDGEKVSFEELQIKLEMPVKLSDNEKEKISEIFENLNTVLADLEATILDMDRDDAYRYMQIILQKFVEAKRAFEEGKEPEPENHRVKVLAKGEPKAIKPAGFFMDMYDQLTIHQKEVAQRSLDCVKTALQLIESGEAPEQVLCDECDLEHMKKCISTEDPNVKDEMDKGIEADRKKAR